MSKEEIEKAIKLLEQWIIDDRKIRAHGNCSSDYDKFCENNCIAIETVLNYIKELEKGIVRLKNKNKKLSEEIIDVKVDKVTKNYIPKQVIRDKIEELEKEYKQLEQTSDFIIADTIQPKIQVLKELLEEE